MNLISGFIKQCLASPERLAFTDEEKQLTYEQVAQTCQPFTDFLNMHHCAGQCIALAIERGIDAAQAIVSILTAGACYLPLDIKNPASRLNYIIDDAQPRYVAGHGACPDWLANQELWLDLHQLQPTLSFSAEPNDTEPEALAAILYTSGSTGTPKGVALSHRATLSFAEWARSTFAIAPEDRIASLAPFHFDLSVFDLFSSLSAGASVHFMPAALSLAPSKLTAWLNQNAITCWYTVPSLLSFIALKGALTTTPLSNLKTILFAGEVFPTPQLIKLVEQLPTTEFFNLYGPTETNVCSYWPVDRFRLRANQAIPIGIPACNALLKIDEATGELLVQSPNNFSGYWQQGKLDRSPLRNGWHHTGDKVSRNEQNEYCYHGRLDRMLKCSGYRVEPAEIEATINRLPEVMHCAVLGISDPTSGQRPVAAVVLKTGCILADIIKPVKETLPSYMQPAKFIVLETLPVMSNGKTDYQALQAIFQSY
ncbi:MAG: AMP-binding protein [Methylococcaceae bacterium]|nr:AMP-binding protein [Methylococcaceae bacterium]